MKKIDLNKMNAPVGTYKCDMRQELDILPTTEAPYKLIDVVPIKSANIVIHVYRQEVKFK